VLQGGDPTGNGTGGPGYRFNDEPVVGDYTPGAVAMANSGPNTNGSQFFIMKTQSQTLPKQYNLFGRVIEGQNVVDTLQRGDRMDKITITEG
jgi:cyclophilin family peptidyl-prolyl cis-trans isomerase